MSDVSDDFHEHWYYDEKQEIKCYFAADGSCIWCKISHKMYSLLYVVMSGELFMGWDVPYKEVTQCGVFNLSAVIHVIIIMSACIIGIIIYEGGLVYIMCMTYGT